MTITDREERKNLNEWRLRDGNIKIAMRELSERTERNKTAREAFKLLICNSYAFYWTFSPLKASFPLESSCAGLHFLPVWSLSLRPSNSF